MIWYTHIFIYIYHLILILGAFSHGINYISRKFYWLLIIHLSMYHNLSISISQLCIGVISSLVVVLILILWYRHYILAFMCLLIISLGKNDFALSKEKFLKFLLYISKLASKKVIAVNIPINRILDFTGRKMSLL